MEQTAKIIYPTPQNRVSDALRYLLLAQQEEDAQRNLKSARYTLLDIRNEMRFIREKTA